MFVNRHCIHLFLVALIPTILCACGPLVQESRPRYFWPPPPVEPKIEYLNYYFTDEDLMRGVDRRLEEAILGRKIPQRLIVQPFSVASDGRGRLFVADLSGGIVHVFDIARHKYRVLVSGLSGLRKVFVDDAGEIWVLDGDKKALLRYSAEEKRVAEFLLADIGRAASFAVDSSQGIIYVPDSMMHNLRLFDLNGRFLRTIGRQGALPGEFNYPGDIDLDADGNLYVVDAMNARIQILAPEGTVLRTFGERGTALGSFAVPKGIAVGPSGLVYVSDSVLHKIVIFSNDGDFLLSIGGRYVYSGDGVAPGGLNFPVGLDADANDTLWVADLFNGLVHEFQYLTSEYLAKRPIREEDIYRPTSTDYLQGEEEALLPPPIGK